MSAYAKGEKPRDLEAACGGEVLGRIKSFMKEPDQFHPGGAGMLGPENTQNYAKGGPETNDGDGDEPKRKGDKSLSMGSIKKK